MLFKGNKEYSKKEITSLHQFRKILGNPKIRSYADNIANIYRRKAGKSLWKRQKGIPLNNLEVNYQKIKEMWEK